MKKLFILISLISLSSCSNDNDGTAKSNSKNYLTKKSISNYENIINLDKTSSQKLATYSLNPTEINEIWQLKLDNFLENNELNSVQQNFILKLKSEINSNLFVKNNAYRNSFLLNKKDKYMEEAKSLFGENEGWYLLTKIENINQRFEKNKLIKNSQSDKVGDDPIKSCDCDNTRDCKRLTGIGIWSISWEYGECKNKSCYISSFLGIWESDNDGLCEY